MATLDELRARSDALFTELLKAQATERPAQPSPRRPAAPGAPPYRFSWFDLEDGMAAAALSFRFAALAASGETVEEGLSAALDDAEEERERVDPEEVQIALALFVTHNDDGRRLAKPRAVAAAPELFSPPAAEDGLRSAVSVGGLSPALDYWREDALANEHHQHWHQVYPWPGLQPRRFADWVTQRTPDELVAILNGIQPDPGWPNVVATSTPTELAATFVRVLRNDAQSHANRVFRLPRNLYALLFRLNDRQGELFFYMHEQMLARYDAELLSHGLARVAPFGPDEWDDPIAAGHNPVGLPFGHRDANVTLPSGSAAKLHSSWDEIDDALRTKRLRGLGGTGVPIDRENLGEAVESTVPQLRALAENAYNQPHGSGHVEIAHLAKADDGTPKDGVMITPAAAIRDPVFWQWHKAIDSLSARWQEGLEPYRFDDNPPVRLRNALDPSATTPWTSPDIILCRTSDLPEGADPAQLGTQLFGGESWSTDFTAAHAASGGTSLQTIDELTTTMRQVAFGGGQIRFLSTSRSRTSSGSRTRAGTRSASPSGSFSSRRTSRPSDARGWRWTSSWWISRQGSRSSTGPTPSRRSSSGRRRPAPPPSHRAAAAPARTRTATAAGPTRSCYRVAKRTACCFGSSSSAPTPPSIASRTRSTAGR
jgi:Hemocyanin, copper containing domain